MVGLWVFLWWFAVDLRWIAVVGLHLQWFLIFSFFHFTLPQTLENIFQTIFQNAIKHRKIFPEIIYICKHLRWKIIYVETNRALVNTCAAKLISTPLEKARNPQGVTMRGSNLGPLVNVMFQTD